MTAPGALTDDAIAAGLAASPEWTRTDARIERAYVCADFADAIAFVVTIAGIAEALNHHPDLEVRWNLVVVSSTTHDAGALTALDFALATQLDAAYARR